jgi:hypothetical protein
VGCCTSGLGRQAGKLRAQARGQIGVVQGPHAIRSMCTSTRPIVLQARLQLPRLAVKFLASYMQAVADHQGLLEVSIVIVS